MAKVRTNRSTTVMIFCFVFLRSHVFIREKRYAYWKSLTTEAKWGPIQKRLSWTKNRNSTIVNFIGALICFYLFSRVPRFSLMLWMKWETKNE